MCELRNLINQVYSDKSTMIPYAVLCNPAIKLSLVREVGDKLKVEAFSHIPKDTVYVVDKESYDRYMEEDHNV